MKVNTAIQKAATRARPLSFSTPSSVPRHDLEKIFEAGLEHHHLATTAYPIVHRKTIWGYRVDPADHAPLLRQAILDSEGFCLYAHIPFCERRCSFCEYCVVKEHNQDLEERYHQALMGELERYISLFGGDAPPLEGFDIGGGTPSLIQPERVAELVRRVRGAFEVSPGFGISIETTPRLAALHPERLAAYRANGIDRISMGLQMTNPRLLRRYGRDGNHPGHNASAVKNIRAAGFQSFNIDLMYGLAHQTEQDLARALSLTMELGPEHITLYRMRYKGTTIAGEAGRVELDRVVAMYNLSRALLLDGGYQAPPGKNTYTRTPGASGASAYLTARVMRSTPYIGLGLGAQTFTNNILAYNVGAASKRLGAYLAASQAPALPIQDLYHLPREEGMAKMVSVSFYFGAVDRQAFQARFGIPLEQRFAREVRFLSKRGLCRLDADALRMTRAGAMAFNGVLALFYSSRVQDHLVGLS